MSGEATVTGTESGAAAEEETEDATARPEAIAQGGAAPPPPSAIRDAAEASNTGKGGVLPAAQVKGSHPSARSASDAFPDTTCGVAKRLKLGTGNMTPSPNAQQAATSSREKATTPFASTGSAPPVARHAPTTTVTSVPAAAMSLTALLSAVELRANKARTPYIADNWEKALHEAGLWSKYAHIPDGFRYGFDIGLPPIHQTQTPPNKPSLTEHMDHFNIIIINELNTGRYIGPATKETMERAIGPFQTSPLSIIPKSTPGKFRPVENFSFPIIPSTEFPNPSVNSQINGEDFPTTWGTFITAALLIYYLPTGSQAGTRDVKEAYRTVPSLPSQWPASVVRVGDLFYIDTALAFGEVPSSGIYGTIRNASLDIMRYRGIGPISAWVDDHLFIRLLREHVPEYNKWRRACAERIKIRGEIRKGGRILYGGHIFEDGMMEEFDEDYSFPCAVTPRRQHSDPGDDGYAYGFGNIDAISDELGVPWEPAKDQHFASTTIYIGFLWDLEGKTVQLSTAKTAKYLKALDEWAETRTHARLQIESLYGKLLHTCLVVPAGRAYLTILESMLATSTTNPHLERHDDKRLAADLLWWRRRLENPSTLTREIPHPLTLTDAAAYSDASSGVGIAIIVGGRWRAWRLLPGWRTRNGKREIGWAEAVGFELLVRQICAHHTLARAYRVHGDNQGVIDGWGNGRSRNREVNEVFKRLHALLESLTTPTSFFPTYIRSADNPADAPSRGVYPPSHLLLPLIPIPPELSSLIIDATEPFTKAERTERSLAHSPQKR